MSEKIVVMPTLHSGINGFLFDKIYNETLQFGSNIGSVTSGNGSYTAAVSPGPLTLTLQGLTGQLQHNIKQKQLIKDYKPPAFLSNLSGPALAIVNTLGPPAPVAAGFNLAQSLTGNNLVLSAVSFFMAAWQSRWLLTVDTAYCRFNNMLIKNLVLTSLDSGNNFTTLTLILQQATFKKAANNSLLQQSVSEEAALKRFGAVTLAANEPFKGFSN
ncbi:MAG: hypothetical protein FWE37_06245 [Spirochaetaceae bacterium]|nr:hypothetical protein [Spirochaetaceae bacterium]